MKATEMIKFVHTFLCTKNCQQCYSHQPGKKYQDTKSKNNKYKKANHNQIDKGTNAYWNLVGFFSIRMHSSRKSFCSLFQNFLIIN